MNFLSFKLIKHSEINSNQLIKIVEIKKQHWNYSDEEHLNWIENNINNEDYHLLIQNDNQDILAYLNLVNLIVEFDNKKENSYLGIGNVCVKREFEGKGLGLLLIQSTNFLLKQLQKEGCLICKPHLHNFYSKANWFKFENDLYLKDAPINNANIYFSKILDYKKITINKNF